MKHYSEEPEASGREPTPDFIPGPSCLPDEHSAGQPKRSAVPSPKYTPPVPPARPRETQPSTKQWVDVTPPARSPWYEPFIKKHVLTQPRPMITETDELALWTMPPQANVLRRCTVDGRAARFMGFYQKTLIVEPGLITGGQVAYPVAVVEYENGQVETIPAEMVRFDPENPEGKDE